MKVFTNIFARGSLSERSLNSIPDGVLVISSDGEIFQSNEQAQSIFKMSAGELRSHNISDIIDGAILVVDTAISTGKVQICKAIIVIHHEPSIY